MNVAPVRNGTARCSTGASTSSLCRVSPTCPGHCPFRYLGLATLEGVPQLLLLSTPCDAQTGRLFLHALYKLSPAKYIGFSLELFFIDLPDLYLKNVTKIITLGLPLYSHLGDKPVEPVGVRIGYGFHNYS